MTIKFGTAVSDVYKRGGRTAKNTGRFDTYQELCDFVRENRRKNISYSRIAKDACISTGTVSNVMKSVNNAADPEKKRLNKLLHSLWKPHGLIVGGKEYEQIYRIPMAPRGHCKSTL